MPIDRIEIFVTDLTERLRRLTSSGAYDTGPAGSLIGKPVLIKIFADGVVGMGQIRPISPGHFMPDTVASIVSAVADFYAPRLLGQDLFALDRAGSMFDRVLPANANARALVDHALHDAMGKALKVPVYALLGGLSQPRIPMEWSVSMAERQADMVAESVRAISEFGIRVICLKAGGPGGWKQDVANFAAVRKEVGPSIEMGMDPNCGWSVPDAKRALRALAEHRLDYLEQPVERRNIDGMKAIREIAQGVPIMADEGVGTLQDAFALARAQAVDVFCIKLYKNGGIRQAKKIAAVAEAADILLNFGGLAAFCQLEAAACAHLYASTAPEQTMPAGEFIFGLGVKGPDPLVPDTDFLLRDGHCEPPHRPGLGITIDETALARHTLQHRVIA